MTAPPPFPRAFMNTHGDGAFRPPEERGQRIFSAETPEQRAYAERVAQREAATLHQQLPSLPARPDLVPRAPRAVLIENPDGSKPGPVGPPLMTGVQFEGRVSEPRALPRRPAESPPLGAEQQRHQMAMAAVQGAWSQREREDAEDMRRRQAIYLRYTSGGRG